MWACMCVGQRVLVFRCHPLFFCCCFLLLLFIYLFYKTGFLTGFGIWTGKLCWLAKESIKSPFHQRSCVPPNQVLLLLLFYLGSSVWIEVDRLFIYLSPWLSMWVGVDKKKKSLILVLCMIVLESSMNMNQDFALWLSLSWSHWKFKRNFLKVYSYNNGYILSKLSFLHLRTLRLYHFHLLGTVWIM